HDALPIYFGISPIYGSKGACSGYHHLCTCHYSVIHTWMEPNLYQYFYWCFGDCIYSVGRYESGKPNTKTADGGNNGRYGRGICHSGESVARRYYFWRGRKGGWKNGKARGGGFHFQSL